MLFQSRYTMMRYLKKYNYLVLKILIIQETRNLLSSTFILVREKNISTIYFVSFLNLFAGKHKTLMYYLDLFPNFKIWFFAKYSSMNLCPLLFKLCPLLLELFLYCLKTIIQLFSRMQEKNQPSIDAFELWCWRRLLRVPWTARRSKQSILKEISPEYSLEGLMLKLKFQYFGHGMQRISSMEKTLMLGKTEGGRRRGRQRMVRWHHQHNGLLMMDMRRQGVGDGQCAAVHGVTKSWTKLSDWTDKPAKLKDRKN